MDDLRMFPWHVSILMEDAGCRAENTFHFTCFVAECGAEYSLIEQCNRIDSCTC